MRLVGAGVLSKDTARTLSVRAAYRIEKGRKALELTLTPGVAR